MRHFYVVIVPHAIRLLSNHPLMSSPMQEMYIQGNLYIVTNFSDKKN